MISTGLFVFSVLPMLGKAWGLLATGLMLVWYLRYNPTRHRLRQPRLGWSAR
jgi:hypothetical protein